MIILNKACLALYSLFLFLTPSPLRAEKQKTLLDTYPKGF